MSNTNPSAQIRQHHVAVVRARRKAIALWTISLAACASLAALAVICAPALAERGQLWALSLFVVAGGGFVYVISSVDKSSRALWPTGMNHFAAALRPKSSDVGS